MKGSKNKYILNLGHPTRSTDVIQCYSWSDLYFHYVASPPLSVRKSNGDGADLTLPVGAGGLQSGAVLPAAADARWCSPLPQRGRGGTAACRQLLPRVARYPRLQDGGHLSDGGAQPEEGRLVLVCTVFWGSQMIFFLNNYNSEEPITFFFFFWSSIPVYVRS